MGQVLVVPSLNLYLTVTWVYRRVVKSELVYDFHTGFDKFNMATGNLVYYIGSAINFS